jgi:hypothetical protein
MHYENHSSLAHHGFTDLLSLGGSGRASQSVTAI